MIANDAPRYSRNQRITAAGQPAARGHLHRHRHRPRRRPDDLHLELRRRHGGDGQRGSQRPDLRPPHLYHRRTVQRLLERLRWHADHAVAADPGCGGRRQRCACDHRRGIERRHRRSGDQVTFTATATDADGDTLSYTWYLWRRHQRDGHGGFEWNGDRHPQLRHRWNLSRLPRGQGRRRRPRFRASCRSRSAPRPRSR